MEDKRITGRIDPRGQVMKTPEDVEEMLRLKACGWGLKRIGRELGCSHHTVREYITAGDVKPFRRQRGRRSWMVSMTGCANGLMRHRGNADVVRQDLFTEKKIEVSRRTLQRAVQPYCRSTSASKARS